MSGPTKDEIAQALIDMTQRKDGVLASLERANQQNADLMRERDEARAAFGQVNLTFAASTERVERLEARVADLTGQNDALVRENEAIIAAKGFRERVAMTEHEIYGLVYSIVASQSTAGEWAYQLRQRVEHGVEIAEAILDRTDAAVCGASDDE